MLARVQVIFTYILQFLAGHENRITGSMASGGIIESFGTTFCMGPISPHPQVRSVGKDPTVVIAFGPQVCKGNEWNAGSEWVLSRD